MNEAPRGSRTLPEINGRLLAEGDQLVQSLSAK
jgi:hypothetical protein